MMIRRLLQLAAGTAILAAATTGCGADDGAEQVSAAPRSGVGALPWDELPLDSIYGATPVQNLTTTEVELDVVGIPEGWNGLRIAAISDLQLGLWEDNEQVASAAARRAAELQPDLVVLLGDYLARGTDTLSLRRALEPLRGRPVLAVLGDRDVRTDSVEARVTRTLSQLGFRVLNGSATLFEHGGDAAVIAGVNPEIVRETAAEQAWILSQLGTGRMGLLLSHNPVLAGRSPRNRFPAALAGGVFCGRVEMPGTPRLSWLHQTAIPGATIPEFPRIFRFDRMMMFVTCGVGYSFVPIRFGAAPEVALITLRLPDVEPTVEDGVAADTASIDTLLQRYQESAPTPEN